MTKPPENMTSIWVRDESGNLRNRIKKAARRKGQTVADFLFRVIDAAVEDKETSFVAVSDRKSGQSERREYCPDKDN